MGTNLMRLDDSYSFWVIQQAVQKIIPAIVADAQFDVNEIIKVFCGATPHIPKHRLGQLFSALIQAIGGNVGKSIKSVILLLLLKAQSIPEEVTAVFLEQQSIALLCEVALQVNQALLTLKEHSAAKIKGETVQSKKAIEAALGIPIDALGTEEQISAFVKNCAAYSLELQSKFIEGENSSVSQTALPMSLAKEYTSSLLTCALAFPKERTTFMDTLTLLHSQILSPSQFFPIIFDLLLLAEHPLAVRRRALKILNDTLEHQEHSLDQDSAVLEVIVGALPSFAAALQSEDLPSTQVSLMALDMLCKRFGSVRPNEFYTVAQKIVTLNVQSMELKMTLVSALKGFVVGIPHRMIPFISFYLPLCIELLGAFVNDSVLLRTGAFQVLSTLLAIVNCQGLFLSPFLGALYQQLIALSELEGAAGEKSSCSGKSNSHSLALPTNISQQLNLLLEAVGQKIEARISLPIIFSLDSSGFPSRLQVHIEMAMRHLPTLNKAMFSSMQPAYTRFVLQALEAGVADNKNQETTIQPLLYEAIAAFSLKMNSSTYEAFFAAVCQWAFTQPLRLCYLADLCVGAFKHVDSGMFFAHFQGIVPTLINDYLCIEGNAMELDASESVSSTQSSIFIPVSTRIQLLFAFQLYFEAGLAAEVETTASQASQFTQLIMFQGEHLLVPAECLASLAVALGNWIGKAFISSNEHWMAFNGQLLESLGHGTAGQKKLLCFLLQAFFEAWGEEYLGFLPTLLPVISEVVEDVDEQVEAAAKALVATIEKFLGEPIGKYLE